MWLFARTQLGRAHLTNSHWPYQTALKLKVKKPFCGLLAPYAYWLEKYRRNV